MTDGKSFGDFNIPRHILLRELGGCVSILPLKVKQRSHKDVREHNDIGNEKYHSTSSRKKGTISNSSLKKGGHANLANHPRINVNIIRYSFRILRDLISSTTRHFLPIDAKKNPIVGEGVAMGQIYADRKLFIRNKLNKTYDCFAIVERNHKLYSLPSHPKWEDCEIIAHSTANILSKPVIIILKKGNSLHVHDLQTGSSIQKIDLGSRITTTDKYNAEYHLNTTPNKNNLVDTEFNVTYKELYNDLESSYICIKSTRRPKPSDVLVSFILFTYPPLEVVAKFNVCRSIFGTNITDAEVSQDILMIMETGSVTKLYSLQSVLNNQESFNVTKNYMSHNKYNSSMSQLQDDGSTFRDIKQLDSGRKSNVIEITEKPPCLYDVKSFQHNLQFSPAAGMKLITCGLNDHNFKLQNMSDLSLVRNGMVGMRDPEGINNFRFHPDDSSRAIYLHSPHLSIYEFHEMENLASSTSRMHKTFNYHVTESNRSNLKNEGFNKCYEIASDRDIINFHSLNNEILHKSTLKASNETYTNLFRPIINFHSFKDETLHDSSLQASNETNTRQLHCEECGESIDSKPNSCSSKNSPKTQSTTTTKSGRKVVQRISTLEYDDLVQKRNYITYDYEDELDILVLLTYNDFNETFPDRDDDDEDFMETQYSVLEDVILLDNTTYDVIKRIPIGEVLKHNKVTCLHNVSVTLDRDLLLVRVQSGNTIQSFVYQLSESFTDEELFVRPEKNKLDL